MKRHLDALTWLSVATLFLFAMTAPARAAEPAPQPATGSLERLELKSAFVDPRRVDVWLPDGYAEGVRAGRRYQVLYMHDGQMLYDPKVTWNGQAWQVDVALTRLMREGKVADTIVVGVWNNGKYRAAEFFPQKFLDHMPPAVKGKLASERLESRPQADNYLRFLVQELKPLVDKRFATRPEAASTFIMGSSMGGLISLYAFVEYPEVFGGAAALSTHWIGRFEANAGIPLGAFNYLQSALQAPGGRRLYMDTGTATLDALYPTHQAFVDLIVRERGYTDANFMSKVFEGEDHSEKAWAKRVDIPLLFLLGKR